MLVLHFTTWHEDFFKRYFLNVTCEFLPKYLLLALRDSHGNLLNPGVGCLLLLHTFSLTFLLFVNVPSGNSLKLIWGCLCSLFKKFFY